MRFEPPESLCNQLTRKGCSTAEVVLLYDEHDYPILSNDEIPSMRNISIIVIQFHYDDPEFTGIESFDVPRGLYVKFQYEESALKMSIFYQGRTYHALVDENLCSYELETALTSYFPEVFAQLRRL